MVINHNSTFSRRNTDHADDSNLAVNEFAEPIPPVSVYAASVIVNCLSLALPLFILQIYDRIIPNAALNTLTLLGFGLVFIILVDGALKYLRGAILNWNAVAFIHNTSLTALKKMLASSPNSIASTQSSTRLSQFNAITSLGEHHGGNARIAKIDVIFIPFFLGVIMLIGGIIVLIPVILFCIFAIFAFKRTNLLRGLTEEQEIEDSRKYDFITEILGSMHTVKAHAMEHLILRRFERLQSGSSATLKEVITLNLSAADTGALFATLSTTAIVTTGALLVMDGQLTVGGLAACTLLSSQLLQPVLRFISSWSELQLAGHKRLMVGDLLASTAPAVDFKGISNVKKAEVVPRSVEFSNVTIKFEDEKPILSNLSVKFDAGRTIALRGADGSGRTAILKAVCGDIKPDRGGILIGGESLYGKDFFQLRRFVQYVDQTPMIFHGSILENLTLFGALPVADALDAAKRTGLNDQINRMPLGYDTAIRNSSGRDLPAAFSQQICITRAIAAKPSILIFDEANTALDALAEGEFVKLLKNIHGELTIIIATHRPSINELADDVFDIQNANLVLAPSSPQDPIRRAS